MEGFGWARNPLAGCGLSVGGDDRLVARLAGWSAVAILAWCAPAGAHENWIDLESFHPAAGSTSSVYVRSGHYFPKPAQTLSEKVMRGVSVRLPDGQVQVVEVTVGEKQWEGTVGPVTGGAYVFSFTLGRARASRPKYEGKAIVVVGSGSDDPATYALGTGLELVPKRPVSQLAPGQELPVLLVLDGEPVAGELAIVPAEGRSTTARAAMEEAAVVDLREAGRYLVTASVGGRGCSLVFEVRQQGEGAR